ncbi:MAG: ATP-dependent helicase HrpB [Gammaproteobacteria bacterium]|nr:ATP-dependent helicase HrpB [Gammaproteobacteria bacterium]
MMLNWKTHALPIDAVLADITGTLARNANLVLQAPPGAGKTTRVPLALLDAPWLQGRRIVMLEPRRLATRAAAERLAAELGEKVGGTVGYRIRFENRVSAATRIEVVTEGILTRRLQRDPELSGVGLVIFDEFHERHLHSDLALALCVDAQRGLREDLKLLVMSATLDGGPVARLLDAPVITSEGRSHPVDVRYLARDPEGPLPEIMRAAVTRALAETRGDILAFLPGAGEIQRTRDLLTDLPHEVQVHTLYGDMPMDAQQRAIAPDRQGRRKVVLATNIAETSLTIEGVAVVIDSGFARVPRFDPNTALTRLDRVRIARASADQRAGRAGRLGPGVCYRLWGENTQRGLVPFAAAEIAEADLAPLALELALWGADADGLVWLDPPPHAALAQARDLLKELDILDGHGRITAAGREIAEWPVHPRLGHLLREGRRLGLAALACDVAALLSERDVFRGPARDADLSLRLDALRAFRRGGRDGARRLDADPNACASVNRAAEQYRRLLDAKDADDDDATLGVLLAFAYPDRIAQLRSDGERLLLANGRGARLPQGSHLAKTPWLVAAVLDGRGDDSRVRLAAEITLAQLRSHFQHRIESREVVRFDERRDGVTATREERLGALVLESKPLATPPPGAITAALLDAVRSRGLSVLPWSDTARELVARVESLRHWLPEEGWPDLSEAALLGTLEDWLAPYLDGLTRLEHLVRLNLYDILLARLDWAMQKRLEEGAPTHIAVPSGSRKRLTYKVGESPVLAVKLQEMFGQADTPRVAFGKVPVTLHLLSPAQRPIQVTQDLKGFWERTYAEVKKELKGRYPKHPWPDDPWSAVPTARAKPRN